MPIFYPHHECVSSSQISAERPETKGYVFHVPVSPTSLDG